MSGMYDMRALKERRGVSAMFFCSHSFASDHIASSQFRVLSCKVRIRFASLVGNRIGRDERSL
jgi:hypothetical protein